MSAKIEYGIICKIYDLFIGGRLIRYANVYSMNAGTVKKVALWKLEVLAK